MILWLSIVLYLINGFQTTNTGNNDAICQLRCVAGCVAFVNVETNGTSEECDSKCEYYHNPNLCSDDACWATCNNTMSVAKVLPAPLGVSVTKHNGLTWKSVPGAVFYLILYRLPGQTTFPPGQYIITQKDNIPFFEPKQKQDICSEQEISILAIEDDAVGVMSDPIQMPSPKPSADPKLTLVSMKYYDKKFVSDFYEANGTIEVTFKYDLHPWPFGADDLEVTPLFHLISCIEPDLSQGIPVPEFQKGQENSTIVTSLGSDMMSRKCRFVYYLQSVESIQCGTMTEMRSPPSNSLQTVQIQCDKVENAPCVIEQVFEHPVCGQVDNINYKPISDKFNFDDEHSNVTLNVTFIPLTRTSEPPTLYYVGLFGEAVKYPSKEEETFLGVNITKFIGQSSSCTNFGISGECLTENYNHSLIIEGVHPKQMYGITICAIKDPRNLTLPNVTSSSRSIKPKADKIILVKKDLNAQLLTHPEVNDFEIYSLLTNKYEDFYVLFTSPAPIQNTIEAPVKLYSYVENQIETPLEIYENEWRNTSVLISDDDEVMENLNDTQLTISDDETNNTLFFDPDNFTDCYPTNSTMEDFNITLTNNTDYESDEADNITTTTILTTPQFIVPNLEKSNIGGIVVGSICGGIIVAALLVGIIIFYLRKKHRKQEKLYKLKIAQIDRDNQNRYIDFPAAIKKHDIWEIERRNLIIHNDKKLGSGAFGAVYLGKLIGKSLAHKDANSPLGVNLMRAENCQVAVKMLPEYADDMSKSEFLREIGLMKTLGYHERLVNMLACVTDSEPLCLIVEYCSDGDLLQHLRQRCKYMMKLDEAGINYHDPPVDNSYDPNMIITIKQLLQFAVQISYGLEYLSQKGFVHRDVAARNVLVHEGNCCKIGDFGLCRYIYADQSQYKSKGGRLPLKWMSPEAIRHYEFSVKSDVWSFGILLFEIITLGGSPYPAMPPENVLPFLESGGRIEQPDNCPDNFYEVMQECWHSEPSDRVEFSDVRMKLATQLEDITEDYSYLKLDAAKDYYNVQYDDKKEHVIVIPADASITVDRRPSAIDIKDEKSIENNEENV